MPFRNSKTLKIELADYGSYLGMEKGCFVVKDRKGDSKKYPLFEKQIGEVILKSGNMVSTGALASCGFWNIDVLVTTQKGKPVAMLKALDDDSHVETRVSQYEAISNGKGIAVAKQIVKAKVEGQNQVLRKYGLKRLDLNKSEGHNARLYFGQIFKLFPENIRPKKRIGFKAYDGINNLFNLGYEILSWKVHKALVNAKLEPYLGFLHSLQHGKPSLVCDLMEIYRFLIDDFLIQHYSKINGKSLVTKHETLSKNKIGKREYLNDYDSKELMRQLNLFFESVVNIPRIRHGNKQTLDTLISEEALLLAKFLRNERKEWIPRLPTIT